jgi:hypothetical protein
MFRTLLMTGWIFAKLLNSILASPNGCETWWSCSWCHYEAIEYLTYSFGRVGFYVQFFSIWEDLGCIFAFLAWFMHCQQGGEFEHVLAYWMHLEGFQVVSSHFWALLCNGLTGWGHRSDWSECWPLFRCWAPIWPVVLAGLTGQSKVEAAALFCDVVCMHSSRGSCII